MDTPPFGSLGLEATPGNLPEETPLPFWKRGWFGYALIMAIVTFGGWILDTRNESRIQFLDNRIQILDNRLRDVEVDVGQIRGHLGIGINLQSSTTAPDKPQLTPNKTAAN